MRAAPLSKSERREAITSIAQAAIKAERDSGIPAEIIAAICALESGFLKHAPGYNAFGIKYSEKRHKKKQLLTTREWLKPEEIEDWIKQRAGRDIIIEEAGPDRKGRRLYRVHDWFAAYDSLEDALKDLAALLKTPRYSKAIAAYSEHRDVTRAVRELAAAGYTTTDPDEYAMRAAAVLNNDLRTAIDEVRIA